MHIDEKPFSCSKCDKTQAINLKTHERVNIVEKPFSCSTHFKNFTQASHLKKHDVIHTGERPFSCTKCTKKFTSEAYLQTHERIHTIHYQIIIALFLLFFGKISFPIFILFALFLFIRQVCNFY